MNADVYSKVFGSFIGNAIGDAFGGAVEFFTADQLKAVTGSDWVADFLPYGEDFEVHPLAIWEVPAPRGTGTDDTRNNQLFAECAINAKGEMSAKLLAEEHIRRCQDLKKYYPRHPDLAKKHFGGYFGRACVAAGREELLEGKREKDVNRHGNASPSLMGMISTAPAGLMRPGDPEAAYRLAFECSFLDVGYGRDATAMMAAMVSDAAGGGKEPVKTALEVDPFRYRKGRVMGRAIRGALAACEEAKDERALVDSLAAPEGDPDVFNPVEVLGLAAAAIHFTGGDPVRSIVISANGRELDGKGKLVKLRDVDCIAGIAGAIAGALSGPEGFPSDWVEDALKANKDAYGIDLEKNAKKFAESAVRSG